MKFSLTADQKCFFEKQQFIEFEGLISESQLAILQRCKGIGRDISRENMEMQKIVRSSLFAKIAKELCGERVLRLGFDELYELPLTLPCSMTLFERSSIAPLVCAVMIAIEGDEDALATTPPQEGQFDPFPMKKGNVLFFLPNLLWEKELLQARAKQKCLLIAYANPRALYIFQEKDPHVHLLKRLGYVFGDRLKETIHPTLGR